MTEKQIHYLAILSPTNEDNTSITIDIEIITDIIISPHWSFYSFARSLQDEISRNGGVGFLKSFTLNKDEIGNEVYSNIFKSKRIAQELSELIKRKIIEIHKEELLSTRDVAEILNQLCLKVRYITLPDGVEIQKGTTIQFGIKNKDWAGESFLKPGCFSIKQNADYREYLGWKYLKEFLNNDEDVIDYGKDSISPSLVEEPLLKNLIEKSDTSIIYNLLDKQKSYLLSNVDLIFEKRPSLTDFNGSYRYLNILNKNNFISHCKGVQGFNEYINQLYDEVINSLANERRIEEFNFALQLANKIHNLFSDLSHPGIKIYLRLKLERDHAIQAACIESLFINYDDYECKKDAVDFSIKLLTDNENKYIDVSDNCALGIFLSYIHEYANKHLDAFDLMDAFDKSTEYNELLNKVIKVKQNDKGKLTKILSAPMKKSEYNKVISILSSRFASLSASTFAHEMAEIYASCFILMEDDEIIRIVEKLNYFSNNTRILDLLSGIYLKNDRLDDVDSALEVIGRLEPHSEVFIRISQNLERAKSIKLLASQNITIEQIQGLTGVEFEMLLKKKLSEMGYEVKCTPTTGDYGADLIIDDKEGTRFIIQCKRFSAKVNLKAVQEVSGALAHYSGDYGIVITSSQFLKSAINLAESSGIELWDSDKLLKFLSGDVSFSVLCGAEL